MFKWLKRLLSRKTNLERLKESKANENLFLFKQNKFYCQYPNCGFVTAKRGATIYHALIHTNERPFKCDHCEKTYNDKSSLNHHLKTHMIANNEIPEHFVFRCSSCDYVTSMKGHYIRHRKTVHAKSGIMYTCHHEGCSYCTEKKGNLEMHFKSKKHAK